jgi:glycosyltransferase involved in cell wall biosynthesis
MATVHIVTSDTGWILERLAREISSRLDYVTFSTEVNVNADLQYYMTYSTYKGRSSKIEIAFFTHTETDEGARAKFFEVASLVDHCVCMSTLYEDSLKNHGIYSVSTISPGVDFDEMRPMLKVGVVGRTYHTGRKGEELAQAVYDMPGIEWHFTGIGWPGKARHVPHGKMGDFYNEMDYILVPAFYEGGPMCVAEALACGTPVIAPPIGWVTDFPHIEYETGNADDLRRVLNEMIAQRANMRHSVLDRTWDAWAAGHDQLFRSLMARCNMAPSPTPTDTSIGPVALLLHGREDKTMGGPSVRVPQTATSLRELGYDVHVGQFPDDLVKKAAIVHGFNIWTPDTGVEMTRSLRSLNKPFVLSTIFLDLSERLLWQTWLPELFLTESDPNLIDEQLDELRRRFEIQRRTKRAPRQGIPGHIESVREMVEAADHVILLSENERHALDEIGAHPKNATIIRNAVETERFAQADPELFASRFGVRNYILCVARIEPRKNQLMLLHALRNLDLPIVLIGHCEDEAYMDLVKRYANENVKIVGRIGSDDPLLASAIAGARVFALPSWSEGAPLAALEAAASGVRMVLSDRSSEREYFGDYARYCDPADSKSIRDAILEAYADRIDDDQRKNLQQYTAENFSWRRYAQETANVYHQAITYSRTRQVARETSPPRDQTEDAIFYDITLSCRQQDATNEISRIQTSIAKSLLNCKNLEINFIAWHSPSKKFVIIDQDAIVNNYIKAYFNYAANNNFYFHQKNENSIIISTINSCYFDDEYVLELIGLSRSRNIPLVNLVHDMAAYVAPFWYNVGYHENFVRNARKVLKASRSVICLSDHVKEEIELFGLCHGINSLKIDLLHDFNRIDVRTKIASDVPKNIVQYFSKRPYILNVGSLNDRKNPQLLYNLWIKLVDQLGKEHCPQLIITGEYSQNECGNARYFKEDKRLHDVVHVLENVNDAALDWLYENALFTVLPSLYEGASLAIAESLARGKICVASKAASSSKIDPTIADFIDPLDIDSWLTRIQMYIGSPCIRKSREDEISNKYDNFDLPTFSARLIALAQSSTDENAIGEKYTLGTNIEFSNNNPVNLFYKHNGWGNSEHWGTWAVRETATVKLNCARCVNEDLVLFFSARSAVPNLVCHLRINGHSIGRVQFLDVSTQFFTFDLPNAFLTGQPLLEIEFQSPELVPHAHGSDSATCDQPVGIGLVNFGISTKSDFMLSDFVGQIPSAQNVINANERYWLASATGIAHIFPYQTKYDPSFGLSTVGNRLFIVVNCHEFIGERISIFLRLRVFGISVLPYKACIIANGYNVGSISVINEDITSVSFTINPMIRSFSSPMIVEFVPITHDTYDENRGDVKRIGIFSIELRSADELPLLNHIRQKVEIEHTVSMRAGGCGTPYLHDGMWYDPESDGVWSFGPVGRLELPLGQIPNSNILLRLKVGGYSADLINAGKVDLMVQGGIEFDLGYPNPQEWTEVILPLVELSFDPQAPVLMLDLVAKQAYSPSQLCHSHDQRLLGVFVSELMISEWRSVPLDIPFSPKDADARHVVAELPWQEKDGSWHLAEARGSFEIKVASLASIWLIMALHNSGDRPVTLNVFAALGDVADGQRLMVAPRSSCQIAQLIKPGPHYTAGVTLSVEGGEVEIRHAMASRAADQLSLESFGAVAWPHLKKDAVQLSWDNLVNLNSSNGAVLNSLSGSWYDIEDAGIWSNGEYSTLRIVLPKASSDKIKLEIGIRAFSDFIKEKSLIYVNINGINAHVIERFDSREEIETIEVDLSKISSMHGLLEINFSSENSACPAVIENSGDGRELSFFLYSIKILS